MMTSLCDACNWRAPLASLKHIPCRCAPYLCCCCAPVGKEATSFKVEPVHPTSWQGDASVAPMVLEATPPPPPRDAFMEDNTVASLNNELAVVKLGPPLKSNLKRSRNCMFAARDGAVMKSDKENDNSLAAPMCSEKRSIKWLDNYGKQLTQVKEFEPSDSEDSDIEHDYGLASCACTIQ